jgi:hypothetical protein
MSYTNSHPHLGTSQRKDQIQRTKLPVKPLVLGKATGDESQKGGDGARLA